MSVCLSENLYMPMSSISKTMIEYEGKYLKKKKKHVGKIVLI